MQQPAQQAKAKKDIVIDMFTTIPAGTIGTFQQIPGKSQSHEVNINNVQLYMDPATFDNTFSYFKQSQLF